MVTQSGGERLVWELELPGVQAKAGKGAAWPEASQAVLKRLLLAEGLDRHVHAAARQSQHVLHDIAVAIIQYHVGAHTPGHCDPGVVAVDTDDERCAHELRAGGGAEADR